MREASGEEFLDCGFGRLTSGGGSGAGTGGERVRGRAVKASGGVMADMTLPKAE